MDRKYQRVEPKYYYDPFSKAEPKYPFSAQLDLALKEIDSIKAHIDKKEEQLAEIEGDLTLAEEALLRRIHNLSETQVIIHPQRVSDFVHNFHKNHPDIGKGEYPVLSDEEMKFIGFLLYRFGFDTNKFYDRRVKNGKPKLYKISSHCGKGWKVQHYGFNFHIGDISVELLYPMYATASIEDYKEYGYGFLYQDSKYGYRWKGRSYYIEEIAEKLQDFMKDLPEEYYKVSDILKDDKERK